ncbi:hypothetical protein [Oceanicoccus sagamiensis]|uniref:Uncharacterized protein n=1 Tax=Oceanicoccus sagamiensis TaxID=716816 RepID=A0A1X9NC94_9GAMM|nr:hypothetical protein [Oceanicoccus sagamiensis]ARN74664.1 hypothetical protein BST96_11345 [Oceanicoccus sagamiensis]
MTLNTIRHFLSVILALYCTVGQAAYCSLRDPVAAITALYGAGVNHRSIVASITSEDRVAVKKLLPFTLHRSEIGRHTLYVIYRDQAPLGFVQARSELAEWGLMEVAWSINVDLTIGGFFFQRCRGEGCELAAIRHLHILLAEKNFKELQQLLSDDGSRLVNEGAALPDEIHPIALLTIRSALKTIAITDISWSKELRSFQVNQYD